MGVLQLNGRVSLCLQGNSWLLTSHCMCGGAHYCSASGELAAWQLGRSPTGGLAFHDDVAFGAFDPFFAVPEEDGSLAAQQEADDNKRALQTVSAFADKWTLENDATNMQVWSEVWFVVLCLRL